MVSNGEPRKKMAYTLIRFHGKILHAWNPGPSKQSNEICWPIWYKILTEYVVMVGHIKASHHGWMLKARSSSFSRKGRLGSARL